MILAAAALKTDRYDERLTRNLLALLRLAGKQGALPDRIDQPALERAGWQSYFNDPRGSHELEMLREEMLPDQVIKSREPKSASQTRSP